MKISRIIIIAFAAFVFGSILILFIDSKKHKIDELTEAEMKSFPLGSFSVLVAEKSADIHVDYANSSKIVLDISKDKVLKNKMYRLSNDTLYVYGGMRTFVKCKKLKAIIGHKQNWVGINSVGNDSLHLDITGGQLVFNESGKHNMQLKSLAIHACDSAVIRAFAVSIDDLHIDAKEKAKLECYGHYKNVDAQLNGKSELTFGNNPLSMAIKRDESSVINVYR